MPREISLTAYEYDELRPLAKTYASQDMWRHMLRTARTDIKETVMKPFVDEYITPNGFTITNTEFFGWLLNGIKGPNEFNLRFPQDGGIGTVDVHKWGETQNAIIPKAFQKAFIHLFSGNYDKDSFYIAPVVDDLAVGPEVGERIRRMSKTGITPCFATMIAGLTLIMKERSKELLSQETLDTELRQHYYAASGRFLCPRQSIIETHVGVTIIPSEKPIMLPETIPA